ncbi:MAG: riboflavin synthase [Alphaproteobacteria bacterium]|nr:riboflavin synthase [Alphaproteobacteria bacterium]
MFTGIITAVGDVVDVERRNGLMRLTVESPYDPAGVAIGASICHDGCCLTVVETASVKGGMRHVVEVAPESLDVTTMGHLGVGSKVNLERALRAGDELGGHIVSGHVDGIGRVADVRADGEGWRISIDAPEALAPLIAPKGSITIDGVSLTVNEVEGARFGVLLIPHTWAVTTLHRLKPDDSVNLEADMLARYVSRILSARAH